jgi:hypothetical protein
MSARADGGAASLSAIALTAGPPPARVSVLLAVAFPLPVSSINRIFREATYGCAGLKGFRDINGRLPARGSPPIISRSLAPLAPPTV